MRAARREPHLQSGLAEVAHEPVVVHLQSPVGAGDPSLTERATTPQSRQPRQEDQDEHHPRDAVDSPLATLERRAFVDHVGDVARLALAHGPRLLGHGT
ncbi:hypothetical protein ACWGPQ_03555 [Saccharomonospora azurea]